MLSVTLTLNEPDALTVIDCVVAPFDHEYEVIPAGADRMTLPPLQKLVGPDGVITADGGGFTVTVVGAEVTLQPAASSTVTV